MSVLILDSEALSCLANRRDNRTPKTMINLWDAAIRKNWDVLVPAAVLAEIYRGGHRDQQLDSFLSRFPIVQVIDTNRSVAREIGHLLVRAGLGSAHHVDATVVTVAALHAPAVIATSDPDDINRLAGDHTMIKTVALT